MDFIEGNAAAIGGVGVAFAVIEVSYEYYFTHDVITCHYSSAVLFSHCCYASVCSVSVMTMTSTLKCDHALTL